MALATTLGKKVALEALAKRREKYKDKDWNAYSAGLYAGSPMYFGCKACNDAIVVPESYISRPKLCKECQAMKDLGWLE